MNELKEKIARAIFESDFPGSQWPDTQGYREVYGANAAAVIRAIEEAGYVVAPRKPTIEIWGVICGVMLVGVFAVLARCLEWALS